MMGDRNGIKKTDWMAWLVSGFFGVLTGAFLVLGYQLESIDRIDFSNRNALLAMLCLMVIITIDTRYVWRNYDQAHEGKKLFGLFSLKTFNGNNTSEEKLLFSVEHLKIWGVLILLNLPVLLAENPGFFVYDAQEELNEVLTRTFTTHHPLVHVLLLGGTIALVHKVTGSWNAGILAYIIMQMLVITCIFAYVITYLQKRGVGRKSRILWTIYYGVFPTIVMYILCSSKDGLFSAFFLLMTVLLIQLCEKPIKFLEKNKNLIAFVV